MKNTNKIASYVSNNFLHKEAAKFENQTGDNTSVGLFIRLPDHMAKQFPPLGPDDMSPPHVTLCIVGAVPKNKEALFLRLVNEEAQKLPSKIKAQLNQVDFFQNPEANRNIPHMSVRFSEDLSYFKFALVDSLQEAGFVLSDSFPTVFRPHVTLAYNPGLHPSWKGIIPQGLWEFDNFEIWGLSKMHVIPLGG